MPESPFVIWFTMFLVVVGAGVVVGDLYEMWTKEYFNDSEEREEEQSNYN